MVTSGFRPLWGRRPKKTRLDGYTFDSGHESNLYAHAKMMVGQGAWQNLKVKPRVHLTAAKILSIPDFSVEVRRFESDTRLEFWDLVYLEAKGIQVDVWRIKKRLWEHYGPAPLWVYYQKGKKFTGAYEEIIPKPMAKCPHCFKLISH